MAEKEFLLTIREFFYCRRDSVRLQIPNSPSYK